MWFSLLLLLRFTSIASCLSNSSCDNICQSAYQAAVAVESSNWVSKDVPSDPFYITPVNASTAKPGDLLRWEDLPPSELMGQNWTIPGGTSLSRFLYMSEDIDGKPIPASGFVLLPYATPYPNKPFNTLVWTHGTAGRIRNCAPSNHRALYYEWEGPFTLVQAGYAVIAPDYAGLGSDIPQGFMYEAGFLHAADAAYSLIAARKILSSLLSNEWVVIGHSEGGMTAWRTNERLRMANQTALLAAGSFLGAVAGAPALRPLDLIPESFRRAAGGPVGDVVSIYFLQSLARLFPNQIHVEDYFSDIVRDRLALADSSCLISGSVLFQNLTQEQLYKNTSWLTHPAVVDWQARYNGAGPYSLAAPMLVAQGLGDILTYANNTERDFNLTCSSFPESKAQLKLYPNLNHDVSFGAASVDYLAWIADRFNGVNITAGCVTETVRPVTDRYTTMQISWSGQGNPI